MHPGTDMTSSVLQGGPASFHVLINSYLAYLGSNRDMVTKVKSVRK